MFYLNQSIGIEFGEDYLKIARITKAVLGIKALNLKRCALPSGDISALSYQEAVITQLTNFFNDNKIKTAEIIIGLPPEQTLLRQIEVPPVGQEEIQEMLEYEIERHLPFASREVCIDFIITEKKGASQKLLLLAARKDKIDQYVDILSKVNLKCSAVDIVSLAKINFLQFNGLTYSSRNSEKPKNYLFVEQQNKKVELALVINGKLNMSRQLAPKELGRISMMSVDEISAADSSIANQSAGLAQKINQEITWWQKNLSYNNHKPAIEHIFVLNKGEAGRALCRELAEKTEIPCLNPDNFPAIKSLDENELDIIEFSGALGLAIRGIKEQPNTINLLPTLLKNTGKKGKLLVTSGLMALASLVLIANLAGFFFKDRRALAKVKQQLTDLQPHIVSMAGLQSEYNKLKTQVNTLRHIKPGKITKLDIIKELTIRLPEDAWLQRLNVKKNTVEISGRAGSASNLIPLLDASPLFENVKFASTITTRGGEMEKFKIRMDLEIE